VVHVAVLPYEHKRLDDLDHLDGDVEGDGDEVAWGAGGGGVGGECRGVGE